MDRERHGTVEPDGSTSRSLLSTRRAVLAAGGTVALGSLAGCTGLDGLLDRASQEAVTNRTASPAGFYAGGEIDAGAAFGSGPVDVRFVPPSLRADDRRVDVEGWSTSTTTRAQDYNSSRSNKPSTIWVPDPHDDDDDGDGILELVAVLDVQRALVVYIDAVLAAVDDGDFDEATTTLDAFINATSKAKRKLERCSSDRCRDVADLLTTQQELAEEAREGAQEKNRDKVVEFGKRIGTEGQSHRPRAVIDDILDDIDSDGDGILDLAAPLYDYLDGEPTIAEHFVVSLPDARVRGGGAALAEEITPKRVIEYFLGEQNADGCAEGDRSVAVHRDLSCRDLLTARLDASDDVGLLLRGIDKNDIRRGMAAFETSGGVVLTGATPEADVAAAMLRVAPDNTVSAVESLDSWGEETKSAEASVSSIFALPVVATPEDGEPMPALFHVRRIRHENQLLYVGGWTIDDGALYEQSATLLTADGPNYVIGVTRSDIDDGGVKIEYEDGKDRVVRKRPGRTKFGNITLSTGYDEDDEHLPVGAHPVCRDSDPVWCWGVQSVEDLAKHETGRCPGTEGDAPAWSVATAVDAPLLHLVGAADDSNDVKFKAGAELSKAVN